MTWKTHSYPQVVMKSSAHDSWQKLVESPPSSYTNSLLISSDGLERRIGTNMWKSNGEWRLTVDYRGLNEVTPPMSAAVPDMLEVQYELESKAAKWYATIDIVNAFFSIPLAAMD
ncbi:hypothetical protein GRJ2_003433200 [Grus japonensis]|uniref:Uncharacterized protein n=1 Tax=Grus japonensis TaxID=30415 RepID=A0ABC9YI00_GRUJA